MNVQKDRQFTCSLRFAVCVLLAFATGQSWATTTVQLPPWVCAHPDAIFIDGFQPASAITRLPSNGSGGATGSVSRTVAVPGYGMHTIHLRVPASYSPTQPMPVVLALHGQAGPGAANNAALSVRNTWSSIADANGFIVVAPVGTGASGGWNVPPANPSDYSIMAAAIADVEAAYNIDRSRRIGWGFSAGGHIMHDLMLNDSGTSLSIDSFAAYAVSAGLLEGLACDDPVSCSALVATASRRIPLDIHVGNGDPLAPQALDDRDIFEANGWVRNSDFWFRLFIGGHNFNATQLGEIWTHLCPFQVLP